MIKQLVAYAVLSSLSVAAMADEDRGYYAVQFHPEFTSNPRTGHPLFTAFVSAALANKKH